MKKEFVIAWMASYLSPYLTHFVAPFAWCLYFYFTKSLTVGIIDEKIFQS